MAADEAFACRPKPDSPFPPGPNVNAAFYARLRLYEQVEDVIGFGREGIEDTLAGLLVDEFTINPLSSLNLAAAAVAELFRDELFAQQPPNMPWTPRLWVCAVWDAPFWHSIPPFHHFPSFLRPISILAPWLIPVLLLRHPSSSSSYSIRTALVGSPRRPRNDRQQASLFLALREYVACHAVLVPFHEQTAAHNIATFWPKYRAEKWAVRTERAVHQAILDVLLARVEQRRRWRVDGRKL